MNEDRIVAEIDAPHEIEKIIAQRKISDAAKASADAEAERELHAMAAKVKDALAGAQQSLLAELELANAAIKRGGRSEEFRYQSKPEPGAEKILVANLTLSDGGGVLRDYVITVDSADGKIVVKSRGITMQQSLTNIMQVMREDWSKFLSSVYAGGMR